jgi:SAM-dependent methyltransferase
MAADEYEAFRPGPPADAIEWLLPVAVDTVVDLGAGTGVLSRQLLVRAAQVIAVEPDDEMRRVLVHELPDVDARAGSGEDLPVEDGAADALIASSSWHWVDPVAGFAEAARVIRSGGVFGALWTGPDTEGFLLTQARALLSGGDESNAELRASVSGERIPERALVVAPPEADFAPVESRRFDFVLALTADQLIGILSTMSWIILLEPDARTGVYETARRILRDAFQVEGPVTIDVEFVCEAFRTIRR